MLTKEGKQEIISDFKGHSKDTGSAAVQIAILTKRIDSLSEHFKAHKKDFHSRRGLLVMVSRRRKLLDYLRKSQPKKYQELIGKLDLKK